MMKNNFEQKAQLVLDELNALYPEKHIHLVHNNPFELLIATILSAQCTDNRVNQITPILFEKYQSINDLANANILDVEEIIRSTGLYKNKAKNIIASAKLLVNEYENQVPKNMKDLLKLPGVARKTANVVLSGAFEINEGIAVDTHVKRIAFRIGLTKEVNPDLVEKDLMKAFSKSEWGNINNKMVTFGRQVCDAKKPKCTECKLADICDYKLETSV